LSGLRQRRDPALRLCNGGPKYRGQKASHQRSRTRPRQIRLQCTCRYPPSCTFAVNPLAPSYFSILTRLDVQPGSSNRNSPKMGRSRSMLWISCARSLKEVGSVAATTLDLTNSSKLSRKPKHLDDARTSQNSSSSRHKSSSGFRRMPIICHSNTAQKWRPINSLGC
jgi:hypothetical protein